MINLFHGIRNCKERLEREETPCKLKPKKRPNGPIQSEMLKVLLKDIVLDSHSLVMLGDIGIGPYLRRNCLSASVKTMADPGCRYG